MKAKGIEKVVVTGGASFIGSHTADPLVIIHMLYFGAWNSEVFSAITGLIGTITGTFIPQRR